jgi:hypothetical protein
VLETSQRVLGDKHPETLASMNNLTFTMRGQGRKGDASQSSLIADMATSSYLSCHCCAG